ncbi:MBL fold metallo-hydrolase RNA specificity domain-containing protein [Pseudoflavonifractor sp. MSJ-37]|uniref:MBL fold metallo-hydrolase RNA specificity domain-containing protein n=1 Tax=Pseudoflavonifractor sp. MSJ-37 TaxID=2841531 RepID=UPI001C10C464|nr:MBL fold metallo-hydrolase [Pseudoflavonifractor sp. MSJ-37]MBU5436076.1 MBL fold metallo-hydrolase [Pseudoflavonifractor sp. MSJ-37]
MKLTFFGAAKAVTGSCHCVECNGKKILIDCGLQQGRDEQDNRELDFNAGYIDAVIVTHAHIDHSGRIPLLVKQGFTGRIYCTRLTGELISIMLRDSAHIQESDAQWQNQKGRRAGREPVEPLYTLADAEAALTHVETCEYGEELEIDPGVKIRFVDAGHLLGSSSVEMWLTEGDQTRKIVFSGDIGNRDQPIIRDPQYIQDADYVLTESTYGDREHDMSEDPDYTGRLAAIIDETLGRGGNVIIPSFAVGRTQELLYFIREMKEEGMVKSVPHFPVYVDSPLAGEATKIFSGDLHGYLDEDAIEALKGGELFQFPGSNITETSEESRALNLDRTPKVIISASGMCDAGRIRHHLKHNLWRPECTVVFVGYQGEGTLGRRLLDGVRSVKLFGEDISVQAKIVNFHGLSSHADRQGLLRWIHAFTPKPKEVFVVHGEKDVTEIYAQTLRDQGYSAHSANYEEVYDLLAGKIVAPGIVLESKPAFVADSASPAYKRLEETGRRLMEVISHNRGGANKDLARFADQLRALIDKWDR